MGEIVQFTGRASEEPHSGSPQRVDGRREQAPDRKWWLVEESKDDGQTWQERERYRNVTHAFRTAEWCFDSFHRDIPKRRWRVVQLVETPSTALRKSPIAQAQRLEPARKPLSEGA